MKKDIDYMNKSAEPGYIFVYTEWGAEKRNALGEDVKAGDPVNLPSGNAERVPWIWIKQGYVKETPVEKGDVLCQ